MFLENGRPYKPASPADARKEHISMIVQETGTIDHLTVAENIFLGSERQFCRFGVLTTARMTEEAQKALDAIGAGDIRAQESIDACNFEQRKIIEIAKALYYDPELFIVDETTTALSQDGRMKIYEIMKNLRDKGKAVVFISHDLPELMEICDTLTVLRDGRLIATMEKADFDENRIKQTMVGPGAEGELLPQRYGAVLSGRGDAPAGEGLHRHPPGCEPGGTRRGNRRHRRSVGKRDPRNRPGGLRHGAPGGRDRHRLGTDRKRAGGAAGPVGPRTR